ncbi:XRE family transcriptional regulator [Neorhizobium sp. P12A]|uniref:helix-turn-helix domain-containing protein n=1 Tax=Neorhizobium sp. P12A TaxID=2268027 RepID=UPI0011EC041B|nr:helix-turn-helix transcriptional regulator [Neorhizobium sp. P12A]KAA0690912.1 XRE family transcriptional regulator [Neorhizobium sp. P12A]
MNDAKVIQQTDAEVGARIRMRRRVLGMSQHELAGKIGVTFQQVQKYEKGSNRVGSSRLQSIASALRVSPATLFGEGEQQSSNSQTFNFDELDDLLMTDALALNRAFRKIGKPEIRSAVIEFVESLGSVKPSE